MYSLHRLNGQMGSESLYITTDFTDLPSDLPQRMMKQ